MGRIKTIDNGPRTIDLDILLYDNETFQSSTLTIPHTKMLEREFVLRPLTDIVPEAFAPTENLLRSFNQYLASVDNNCRFVTPLSNSLFLPPTVPRERRPASLMAIVNVTPDSFSDGNKYDAGDAARTVTSTKQSLRNSGLVSVIDIGGQSTRPYAEEISSEEELSRTIPVIQALRADPEFDRIAISIDTYRSCVARAAVKAGADIVNDVSAGTIDPLMLTTVAELGCTYVMMHMRGTPHTMNKLTEYKDGVIVGVAEELLQRLELAERAGIRRWRIILDPGIGFAKNTEQNLTLLSRFDELRNYRGLRGLPWVVGASRKTFIGAMTGVQEPAARQLGTAVCLTAAVKGGADLLRVHDVTEMTEVVKMANALYC